jgi:inhibitor of cysteine peptidase
MKRRIFLLLSLLISTIFMLSCITSRDIHVEISCEEFTENPNSIRNDFQIEVGDKIYVKLCSNPSTGFKWSYEMSVDNVIKEEGYDFEEPDSHVVGAPGKEVWTFEAIEKGTTVIDMEYSQTWDGGIKDEWTYTINVVVK